jgi:hypothetical protein
MSHDGCRLRKIALFLHSQNGRTLFLDNQYDDYHTDCLHNHYHADGGWQARSGSQSRSTRSFVMASSVTHDIVICNPVRTAIGAFNGTLKDSPAIELGAAVVRETLKRSGLDPASVGSVVMGNVIQAGNKMNPARQAAAEDCRSRSRR